MHEAAATPAWVLIAYLVSGVCFILALRGLSNPESSRRGNRAGMIGMAIAVVTTLAIHDIASLPEIVGAVLVGGGIGSLAAAAFMIRDGKLPGAQITILEATPLLGGSLDGAGDAERGYSLRGGRMLTFDNYECTWDLFKSIPSLEHPGQSVFDETVAFNEICRAHSQARLVDRRRAKVPVSSMGFTMQDRLELLKLMHDECARLSSDEFLLLPGEEPNVHLGGHWISFFPKPVYWLLHPPADAPFEREVEGLGTVYAVKSADDILKLMERENGLMWTAHARTKSSFDARTFRAKERCQYRSSRCPSAVTVRTCPGSNWNASA